MALYLDGLTLFDRINLAACAMRRAQDNTFDAQRFHGEYFSARAWNKYKCVIAKNYAYLEDE